LDWVTGSVIAVVVVFDSGSIVWTRPSRST
jgi:hypothetical protein